MHLPRKFYVISSLLVSVIVCTASFRPVDPPDTEFKNLKVLPKNIPSKELSRIMVDEFQDDLGISCNFCHAENKDTHKPDYASDEKPEKQIARAMMRMTVRLNKKFFKLKNPMIGDQSLVVTCATCHHGQPHPGDNNVQ